MATHFGSHLVKDDDGVFYVVPLTRQITYSSSNYSTFSGIIMQNDHNSEEFTIRLPKIIEGHDMTTCNVLEVHYKNIGSNGSISADVFPITQIENEEKSSYIDLKWLLSNNATKYVGTLEFALRCACVAADGTIQYQWFSNIFKGITVQPSIYNTDIVVEQYSDVLESWKTVLESLASGFRLNDETTGLTYYLAVDNGKLILVKEDILDNEEEETTE